MFWYRNIVLRFQRFLLTWFIQFLYSLLKKFSSCVLTSKSLIWVQMNTLGLFWPQKEIFSLDLKHKIFLAFWKTKSTYFCSKMLYCTHLGPKRTLSTQKELYLDQNIVLKCFETKIFYYGFKGFFWLGLYHSFTLYSKPFPHMFWLQNLSFGSKWLPSACASIWSITLSLRFRKLKVPIFVPKCYTTLIFAPKGPYGHRKDCSWTQT